MTAGLSCYLGLYEGYIGSRKSNPNILALPIFINTLDKHGKHLVSSKETDQVFFDIYKEVYADATAGTEKSGEWLKEWLNICTEAIKKEAVEGLGNSVCDSIYRLINRHLGLDREMQLTLIEVTSNILAHEDVRADLKLNN